MAISIWCGEESMNGRKINFSSDGLRSVTCIDYGVGMVLPQKLKHIVWKHCTHHQAASYYLVPMFTNTIIIISISVKFTIAVRGATV